MNRHLAALLLGTTMLAGCDLTINTGGGKAERDPLLEARLARLEQLLTEKAEASQAPPEERLARIEAQIEKEKAALVQVAAAPQPTAAEPVLATPEGPVAVRDATVSFDPWSKSKLRMGAELEEKFTTTSRKGIVGNRPDLVGLPLRQQRFVGPSGEIVDLTDYQGSKNVVLIFMRGFSGQVCIGCSAQTVALAKSIGEFEKRDAQVVVIFPGSAASVPVFLDAVRNLSAEGETLPFPVLLDVNLNAVNILDIKGSLAKPTSMVVDKGGVVRYAYAGSSYDDRPSVQTLLGEIDALEAPAP